jgi:hypothetical protein
MRLRPKTAMIASVTPPALASCVVRDARPVDRDLRTTRDPPDRRRDD